MSTQDFKSTQSLKSAQKPHIVLVIPRGEAVRNFLYSETLPTLTEQAQVSILSVVDDASILAVPRQYTDQIYPLAEYPVAKSAAYLRTLAENAHDRWLWSMVAQNHWELRDERARERGASARLRRLAIKVLARAFANRPALRALTALEQTLNHRFRSTLEFDELFERLRPDLVFNGSHIHGLAGELPLRVAKKMGIPTAGFIFSWDNLTSRSRIFVPYDHYLVWHEPMKQQLLSIYPHLAPNNVHPTGTPQFDYHFDPELALTREEICQIYAIDPARPYILYTTGIANHFFDEHLHLEAVIQHLRDLNLDPAPQLVVRLYIKGTSPELLTMSKQKIPNVIFPEVKWESRWQTPLHDDLRLYTNLLRHAAMGINAASTVSLELLHFDKPVINLDFDPPGSSLPYRLGYQRHIRFDHYWPVAQSGAVMVAKSSEDMREMLHRGLTRPEEDQGKRQALLKKMFGDMLDGRAARRVGETLLGLASLNERASSPSRRSGSTFDAVRHSRDA